jgi:hypothetical protein
LEGIGHGLGVDHDGFHGLILQADKLAALDKVSHLPTAKSQAVDRGQHFQGESLIRRYHVALRSPGGRGIGGVAGQWRDPGGGFSSLTSSQGGRMMTASFSAWR